MNHKCFVIRDLIRVNPELLNLVLLRGLGGLNTGKIKNLNINYKKYKTSKLVANQRKRRTQKGKQIIVIRVEIKIMIQFINLENKI